MLNATPRNPPDSLVKTFVLSNTPGFFFRAVRADDYPRQLMREMTRGELGKLASGHASSEDVVEVTARYCALIAHAWQSPGDPANYALADASGLPWGRSLVMLAESGSATPSLIIDYSAPKGVANLTTSATTASKSFILLTDTNV